jgi:hypothetical protein
MAKYPAGYFGFAVGYTKMNLVPARCGLRPGIGARCAATPSGIGGEDGVATRDRFFQERVLHVLGSRMSGATLYSAYLYWCWDQRIQPLTQHRFGRNAPWEKRRVGGIVYYLNASLASYTGRPQNITVSGNFGSSRTRTRWGSLPKSYCLRICGSLLRAVLQQRRRLSRCRTAPL